MSKALSVVIVVLAVVFLGMLGFGIYNASVIEEKEYKVAPGKHGINDYGKFDPGYSIVSEYIIIAVEEGDKTSHVIAPLNVVEVRVREDNLSTYSVRVKQRRSNGEPLSVIIIVPLEENLYEMQNAMEEVRRLHNEETDPKPKKKGGKSAI